MKVKLLEGLVHIPQSDVIMRGILSKINEVQQGPIANNDIPRSLPIMQPNRTLAICFLSFPPI